MNEVEKMYKLANIAKPVIKKWYYDGYYEDFRWQSSEEDCTKLLKHFDNSIDKLNDRIQQMKKEENANYDRHTDSVMTEFGRVEKAYIDYPPFTAKKQLELIKLLSYYYNITISKNFENDYVFQCEGDDVRHHVFTSGQYFSEQLASFVNICYELLPEKERKQIKNILE